MGRVTMTAREAADHIGVSYWKVLEMAKRREVKHIRIGGRVIFRQESLDEFLVEQEQQSCNEQKKENNSALRKMR